MVVAAALAFELMQPAVKGSKPFSLDSSAWTGSILQGQTDAIRSDQDCKEKCELHLLRVLCSSHHAQMRPRAIRCHCMEALGHCGRELDLRPGSSAARVTSPPNCTSDAVESRRRSGLRRYVRGAAPARLSCLPGRCPNWSPLTWLSPNDLRDSR